MSDRFFIFSAGGDIKALHAITQGMAADLQLVGRASQVKPILIESVHNKIAFEIGHDFIQRLPRGNHGEIAFAQPCFEVKIRQIACLNLPADFQNDGALDDIAQLAHIARPMMRQ